MAKTQKKTKKADNRKRKFIEECAKGIEPYRAAINAGYSKNYAKNFSHILVEKYGKDINTLKPTVLEAIKEKFKYSVEQSFSKLNDIQELALLSDKKGNYNNLMAAIKAEELKGKMYGVYEADNIQHGVTINYSRNYE